MTKKSDRAFYGEVGKKNYGTPGPLYEVLNRRFHFALDAAADWTNTKHPCYIAPTWPSEGEVLQWNQIHQPEANALPAPMIREDIFPWPAGLDCLTSNWRQVIEDYREHHPTTDYLREQQQRRRFTVFMNPPYGAKITKPTAKHPETFPGTGAFVDGAYQQTRHGNLTVVLLLPAKTGAGWFDRVMTDATEVLRIRGRVPFTGITNVPSFDSVIVVFDGLPKRPGHSPHFSTLSGYNAPELE